MKRLLNFINADPGAFGIILVMLTIIVLFSVYGVRRADNILSEGNNTIIHKPYHPTKMYCVRISPTGGTARQAFFKMEPQITKDNFYCWASLIKDQCKNDSVIMVDVRIDFDNTHTDMTFSEFGVYLFGI